MELDGDAPSDAKTALMIEQRLTKSPRTVRAPSWLALPVAMVVLGGCANVGDTFMADAFIDPAKYDQFDCKQLEAERASLVSRTENLQRLIDKAKTGTGGAVVGEMVYRNDYISVRASARQVEEYWQRNKCVATPVVVSPAAPPAAAAKGKR
jgi:hypothetical protein